MCHGEITMVANLKQQDLSLNHLYDKDYLAWLVTNIDYLKQQNFAAIDLDNLIEELEELGKSQKSALKSNLIILFMHFLKWDYQPEKRSHSWLSSIVEHRRRIINALEDSPSLKSFLNDSLEKCYQAAREDASEETGLFLDHFPIENPYSIATILERRFAL